jgi:hypothetical protein
MDKQTNELITHWREHSPAVWAEGAYGWIGEDGQPVQLYPWQRAILDAWWDNKDIIATLAISNVKKTGKTALNAFLTAWRWLTLPGRHFCAGNDLDQASSRVYSEIADMIKRNPYLSQNCKVQNKQILFIPTRSTLVALAADAAGNAGANHLTASHTETWGILYEAGIRAYEELTPPPGLFYGLPPLRIADSYAGFQGESKIWHELVDRGLTGERVSEDWPIYRDGGLLLFHMDGEEAQKRCFRGLPEQADAYYQEQRRTLRANAYLRMHENQRTSGEAGFVTPEAWAACYDPEVRLLLPGDSRPVVFAADASTSRDLTSLVGVILDPKLNISDVVYVRVWRPLPDALRGGKPTVDLDGLRQEIERLHKNGNVAEVYYDPYQLHSIAMDARRAGVKMTEFPQTNARIEADQALYDAIMGRVIRHYGDPVLSEHVRNAVALETPRGFRLAKERTSMKIDAAVALSMAHYGARNHSWVRRVCKSYQG